MSLFFNGTKGAYLGVGGDSQPLNLVVSYPFTFSVWFFPTLYPALVDIFHTRAGNNDYFITQTAGGNIQISVWNGTSGINTNGGASRGLNRWSHVVTRFASNTSRAIHINGTTQTTNATDSAQTSQVLEAVILGQAESASRYFVGYIGHAAIWNADLSLADAASLGRGKSPLSIRSANLVAYWPLNVPGDFRNIASPKSIANTPFSLNGVRFSNWEPPVQTSLPQRPKRVIETTAAPSIVIPNLYRQRQMQGMAA